MSKEVYADLVSYGAPELPEGWHYQVEHGDDDILGGRIIVVRLLEEVRLGELDGWTSFKRWIQGDKSTPMLCRTFETRRPVPAARKDQYYTSIVVNSTDDVPRAVAEMCSNVYASYQTQMMASILGREMEAALDALKGTHP